MSEFIIKLLGSIHFYFIELPSQLWKKIKTGKTSLKTFKYDNKKVAVVTMPKGSMTANTRTAGSPAVAVVTLFGGIVYAEEGLPHGALLHEIGHLVVEEAMIKNFTNVAALHGKDSSVEELTADDFSAVNGGAESLREFLIDMKYRVIEDIRQANRITPIMAEEFVAKHFDYDLRIERLSKY